VMEVVELLEEDELGKGCTLGGIGGAVNRGGRGNMFTFLIVGSCESENEEVGGKKRNIEW